MGLPALAQAAPGEIKLRGAFAAPLDATPTGDPAKDEKFLCNPEPNGRTEYATDDSAESPAFDPAKTLPVPYALGVKYPGDPGYKVANWPSSADLVQDRRAGESNDLCFGFTLTPNMQPDYVLKEGNATGKRYQATPPLPDVDQTHVAVNAGAAVDNDDLKKAVIELPEGFLGDIDGAAVCTDAQFQPGTLSGLKSSDPEVADDPMCPVAAQVGTGYVRVSLLLGASTKLHSALGGSAALNSTLGWDGGRVYNLEHGPNELGRLGITVIAASGVAPAKFVVSLKISPEGKVVGVVDNAPRRIWRKSDTEVNPSGARVPKPGNGGWPIYVESVGVRAWGSKADHPSMAKDFAEWGTDCTTPLSAKASVTTYAGTTSTAESESFKLTGCDDLPFLPSIAVTTGEKRPGVPTSTAVKLSLGQTTSGPRSALLKDAVVALPTGLELGAQVAAKDGGLPLCTAAQFAKGSSAAATCPAGSKAAEVSIISPLQTRPFVGSAYLGEQPGVGELPSLYIEVAPQGATADDAPRIKLTGSVKVSDDGKITTTINDAPQLRFSEFRLEFPGGDNALFVTPRTCGTTTGVSSLTSYARPTAPVAVESAPLTIDQDCAAAPFSPSIAMGAANNRVGASSPTTVSISRPDRSAWLKDINVSLPSGFLADLNQATECDAGAAATGACPDSSRIATVTTHAGVGPKPLALTGRMYLSARQEGSVAGAVIVVRAKIGDIDLGDVVVPARINLRPNDAGLTLTTSAPLRFKGLALNLRQIDVSLDRENFPLNPTACGPLRATIDATGDAGETGSGATDVSYAGCGDLPFQPAMTAKISGDTKPKGYPQIDVTVTARAGDSNLKGTKVMMPLGLATDTKNLVNRCTIDQFNGGACPAAARVGSAAATVSITSETITGDVFLVNIPNKTLPGLGMSFTGRYTQRITSEVSIDRGSGRLIAEFGSIPDLPLRRLDLKIDGGPKGPIQISPAVCKADTSWDATFTGQGGKTATTKIPVPCSSNEEPKAKTTAKWSRTKGLTFTVAAPTGKKLQSARITLPSGYKFAKAKTAKKYAKAKTSGGKGTTKITKTAISASAKNKKTGLSKVTFTIKPKAYTAKKKAKKGAKLKIKVKVGTIDGKSVSSSLTVKVK